MQAVERTFRAQVAVCLATCSKIELKTVSWPCNKGAGRKSRLLSGCCLFQIFRRRSRAVGRAGASGDPGSGALPGVHEGFDYCMLCSCHCTFSQGLSNCSISMTCEFLCALSQLILSALAMWRPSIWTSNCARFFQVEGFLHRLDCQLARKHAFRSFPMSSRSLHVAFSPHNSSWRCRPRLCLKYPLL